MKIYYPYSANDGKHKYYIITKTNKKIYFGAVNYMDYTLYYKKYGKEIAEKNKNAYIARHSKNNENWTKSGIDTAGFWSRWLLWNLKTIKQSYEYIKLHFL